MLKAVYDTNVVVAAIWKPDGISASVVDRAMKQQLRLSLSPSILTEYQEVLRREKFRFSSTTVNAFLIDVERIALMVYPTQIISAAPHEPDNRFLECAQAAQADYLVTGNRRHFPFSQFAGTKIVSPAEFARLFTNI